MRDRAERGVFPSDSSFSGDLSLFMCEKNKVEQKPVPPYSFFVCDIFFLSETVEIPDVLFLEESSGSTVRSMVIKQAQPPRRLDIGSAQNTPSVPRPASPGSRMVRGTTMIAFRSREKKVAYPDLPRATKTLCPVNCRAIKQNPKK